MRQRRLVPLCLAAGFAIASSLSASGFGLFQHGGRALGQVGAFTARASEPSAIFYNPAAITQLSGTQLQVGLDFANSEDKYQSATGSFAAKHLIDFPPALYATWDSQDSPWAFGVGLDSPYWYRVDWFPVFFPARFRAEVFELRVFEVHPVVAYELGDGWSVGGGLRYLFGSMEQADSDLLTILHSPSPGAPLTPFNVEVERDAKADVDAFTWDAAIHYAAPNWGLGAVYRSNAELKGSGEADYNALPSGNSAVDTEVEARVQDGRASQAFEIPREIRFGLWYAPYPELRLELDTAWQSWSSLENTAVTWSPHPATGQTSFTQLTPRDWEDTLTLRLGAEGNVTDAFLLYGGIAWEPSPVPESTVEPGFSRGDAFVYAAGFSYNFPKVSFDLGYSFHDHDRVNASNQELLSPGVNGSYISSSQVWGFSVRWRW